ncbi:MAG TPA: alpha/beta fold hydrolase [Stellaceae bacterium]|nr:alpha/beta fold hydrolase [Stellaceae bacterium]
MPFIDRDGVALRYEVHGRGPALLLSHSYGATMRMWDRQVAHFADRHRVILWDLRGHGGSADPVDPAAYSQALTIGDMAAILDACDVERAVVGGIGLGGRMSLAFHVDHPERTEALVLCGATPGFRHYEARTASNFRANSRAHSLEVKGLEALGRGREVRFAVHRSALGLACAARGMLVQHDALLVDLLPTVAVPTLIVVGSDDSEHFAAANVMTAMIPGARRVVIQGAGAISNIDQPRAFNLAVASFIDRLPAAAPIPPPQPIRHSREPAAPSTNAGWVAYR